VDAIRLGVLPDELGAKVAEQVRPALATATGREVHVVPIDAEGYTATANRVAPLRQALRNNECDVVVHRVTNVPMAEVTDLEYVTPQRTNPRDGLCAAAGLTLDTLPRGARVGSDELRRSAQLRAMRPDLEVIEVDGDAIAQLNQVAAGNLDAVVLSKAVLEWLGRTEAMSQLLEPGVIAPAPGQGALAVEARVADADLQQALATLDDLPTRLAVLAERTVIDRLEAEHRHPLGTWGRVVGDELLLGVAVASQDGARMVRHRTVAKLPPGWRSARSGTSNVSVAELDDIAVRLGNRVAARITI